MKYEPLRLYLYALLIPVAALLVFYGVLDEESAVLWIGVATAVLGVVAVEGARSKVTPVAKLVDRGMAVPDDGSPTARL